MTSSQTIEQYQKFIIGNYKRYPICLVRGEGSYVWDAEGNRYLDFFPGWGCNLLGHCPAPVVRAVQVTPASGTVDPPATQVFTAGALDPIQAAFKAIARPASGTAMLAALGLSPHAEASTRTTVSAVLTAEQRSRLEVQYRTDVERANQALDSLKGRMLTVTEAEQRTSAERFLAESLAAFDVGERHAVAARQARGRDDDQVAGLVGDEDLGVDERDDVDGTRADEQLADLQRLLAGVRLADQQVVDVDAQLARVHGIEGVLGVDEGGDAALLLGLGHGVERQRRLARGLGAVDLDDAAAGQAADAERDVEPERAGGHHRQVVGDLGFAHLHDGALAELLFDLGQRGLVVSLLGGKDLLDPAATLVVSPERGDEIGTRRRGEARLARALEKRGYEVRTASNYDDALLPKVIKRRNTPALFGPRLTKSPST